jgi:hypothetical protein
MVSEVRSLYHWGVYFMEKDEKDRGRGKVGGQERKKKKRRRRRRKRRRRMILKLTKS